MNESPAYFRVEVSLPLAIERVSERGADAAPRPALARQLAGRARETLSRMSSSHHGELREAMAGILAAVEILEREVEMLHRRALLSSRGLALRSRRVRVGGDGLVLLDGELPASGETLKLYLSLPTREGEQLLVLDAWAGDSGWLYFQDLESVLRDRLVAFVFEFQRRERRRELDAASSA